MNTADGDEIRIPTFKSRLPALEDLSPSSRLLLDQLDERRQEFEETYRRVIGAQRTSERAITIAEKNSESIEKFMRLYWMGAGMLVLIQACLFLVVIYIKIK